MLNPKLMAVAQLILEDNYQSAEPIKTLTPLKGGEWSAAYRFCFDSQNLVIRLSHTPENFCRDKISAQYASPNLPIPQIIKIGRYQDNYYAISPFFSGEPLEKLSASDLEWTIPSLISMMDALQSTNLDPVVGFGSITQAESGAFHCWSEALLDVYNDHPDNLTYGWRKALSETPEIQQKFDRFYKRLSGLVQFCPDQKHLIHSDLLYQNLLVDNHRISALLDWGCAMVGDSAYDLALFAFFEPWFPAFTKVGLVSKLQESYLNRSPDNRRNFDKRMTAYQIHLTLGNIAYCAFSKRKKDLYDHINRLEEVLRKTDSRESISVFR